MIVIDASVWASFIIPGDVNHTASARFIEAYLSGGGTLVEPLILPAELASAVARRTGNARRAMMTSKSLLELAAVEWIAVDHDLALLALQTAAELRLRGADAFYVAVARDFRIPPLTWDEEQLSRAAPVVSTKRPPLSPD